MNDQKQQVAEKLKSANNILVTVSMNPSVDQLAACIGLTLVLNKIGKHATAVFSGKVPSTIEFLKPERTIEKNTDSLRDFIIAIDKAKADKLRYKVEDEVVKIFITPYRASISEKDLIFSQGDFNVDVVVALGVHQQSDVDAAITAHGRILHDAVVISVNTSEQAELGSINWMEPGASGVSELVSDLIGELGPNLLDSQIATALLTGVVAETDHFSNRKTTPQTMTVSAALLSAGADQQLVSTELGQAVVDGQPLQVPDAHAEPQQEDDQSADSPLKITHDQNEGEELPAADQLPALPEVSEVAPAPSSLPSAEASAAPLDQPAPELPPVNPDPAPAPLPEAPADPQQSELPVDPLANDDGALQLPKPGPSSFDNLKHIDPLPHDDPAPQAMPPADPLPQVSAAETLAEIEESVHSPHVAPEASEPAAAETPASAEAPDDLDSARKAVEAALQNESSAPAFDAQPAGVAPAEIQPPQFDAQPPQPLAPVGFDQPIQNSMPQPQEAQPMPPANTWQPEPAPQAAEPLAPYQPSPSEPSFDPHVQPDPPVVHPAAQPQPEAVPAGLPDYLQTPSTMPFGQDAAQPSPVVSPAFSQPQSPMTPPPVQPFNPAVNEQAPLSSSSPSDQPASFPMPPVGAAGQPSPFGMPPQTPPPLPPADTNLPPQGPPPPAPPPINPGF